MNSCKSDFILFWAEGPDDVPNKPIFDIDVVGSKEKLHPIKIENGPETVWPPKNKTIRVSCNVTVTHGHALTLTWFKKVTKPIVNSSSIWTFICLPFRFDSIDMTYFYISGSKM